MKIPLLALLIQGIPEQTAVVALAFVFCKNPLKWKQIIIIGACFAFIAYILRLFPITFGLYTIVLIGLLFIILNYLYKVPIIKSMLVSLISFFTLIIIETVCLTVLMKLLKTNLNDVFANISMRILLSLPQVFIMFFIAIIINKVQNKR